MFRRTSIDSYQRNDGSTVTDLRKANRYQLNAPVLFSCKRSHGKLHEAEGVTRDVSAKGIFVLGAEAPEVGAYIELDAFLPAVRGRGKTVKLHAEGRVLRVEELAGAGMGFAAEVLFQPEPQSGDTILSPTKIQ